MSIPLGIYLRSIRIEQNYSLSDVYNATGITTSRLSKLERGLMTDPPITLLYSLTDFYKINFVDLLNTTGFFYEGSKSFQKVSLLHDDEFETIQNLINILTAGRDK